MTKIDQTSSVIYKTNDYSKFNFHKENRDVRNLEKLIESMKKYGYKDSYPIEVIIDNKNKLVIRSGHHRFEAARELGIEIKYVIVEDNNENLYEIEGSVNIWTLKDYMMSQVRAEKPNYATLKRFHDFTNIRLGACIYIFSNGDKREEFKNGRLKIVYYDKIEKIQKIATTLKEINVKIYNRSAFIKALYHCLFVEKFNVEYFINKCIQNKELLKPLSKIQENIEMIEKIYNFRTSKNNKLSIAFEAKNALKK